MSHVIPTFGRREEAEGGGDERIDVIERAWTGGAEERFQCGEHLFDRVEVGAVGRKKPQLRADPFDGGADGRLFVDREIIEHDHVAGTESRRQDLVDIGGEARRVDRPIEHGRRGHALEPQRGDDGMRLPVAAGGVIEEPFAARTAPVAAQEISGHAALVEEHVLAHVPEGQPRLPLAPGGDDVRAALFGGVHRFFSR